MQLFHEVPQSQEDRLSELQMLTQAYQHLSDQEYLQSVADTVLDGNRYPCLPSIVIKPLFVSLSEFIKVYSFALNEICAVCKVRIFAFDCFEKNERASL